MEEKTKRGRKVMDWAERHPIRSTVLASLILGEAALLLGWFGFSRSVKSVGDGLVLLLEGALAGVLLVYPIILTVINFAGMFLVRPRNAVRARNWTYFAVLTVVLGSLYSILYLIITPIDFTAEWSEQLYNSAIHQPVWTEGVPTVCVLSAVGVAGYLILSLRRLDKTPPLVAVLCISAMYLGIAECVLWCVQIMEEDWLICLFPANCVMLAIRLIRCKILEWDPPEESGEEAYADRPLLRAANRILKKARLWPALAFVLMWPLLGILIGILVLFGQRPDAVVKAWTQTAEWRLSQQTAPPQLYYDEHYLCTVAAGGHKKLVKPIRMGERHGHRVVVNRQLCIANAFEQILEEKTPRFHRAVRHFYDTYGFPVARLIRTKGAADAVYLMMKPLEWIFLAVLYLCDVRPENRIAVQYLPERAGR